MNGCGWECVWSPAAVVILVIYPFNSASLSSDCVLVYLTRWNLVGWCYCLTHVFFFFSSLTFPFFHLSFHSFRLCNCSLSFVLFFFIFLFHLISLCLFFFLCFFTFSSWPVPLPTSVLYNVSLSFSQLLCIMHQLFSTGCRSVFRPCKWYKY